MLSLGAGLGPPQEISLGYDADQLPILIDHGQPLILFCRISRAPHCRIEAFGVTVITRRVITSTTFIAASTSLSPLE